MTTIDKITSRFRRSRPDGEDALLLRLAKGDAVNVLPAGLAPERTLEDDRAELTRIIEALAAAGSIDRATGGHVLDDFVSAWRDAEIEHLKETYRCRESAADHLIGVAEKTHEAALERLGFVAEKCRRHLGAARLARAGLIGDVDEPTGPDVAFLTDAACRRSTHEDVCPEAPPWVAPWVDDDEPASEVQR